MTTDQYCHRFFYILLYYKVNVKTVFLFLMCMYRSAHFRQPGWQDLEGKFPPVWDFRFSFERKNVDLKFCLMNTFRIRFRNTTRQL